MKSVRQQRAGRGYLDAVLHDAGRHYDFRGGLRRLLNIGTSVPVRAAYVHGSIPFSLKYLQHSAYGYGGEWSAVPPPIAVDPINYRHHVLQPLPVSVPREDAGESRRDPAMAPSARVPGNEHNTRISPVQDQQINPPASQVQNPRINPPASQVQPHTPIDRSKGITSSEHLREGPPPLVTTRSIGVPRKGIQEAVPTTGNIDGANEIGLNSSRERDLELAHLQPEQMDKLPARNQMLSRLARQLEAHNFGDRRQDARRQPDADSTPAAVPEPVSRDQGYPVERRLRSSESPATDTATSENRITPSSLAQSGKPAAIFHTLPDETPSREQLRLMRSLKKQTTAIRGEGGKTEPQTPASPPVKANKKAPVRKAQPVVRYAIVRSAAAPAFWERSYLSHAFLRIYK